MIQQVNGRPQAVIDGSMIAPSAYCDYIIRKGTDEWRQRVEQFVRSGVKVFMLNVRPMSTDYFDSPFWPDDGVFPDTEQDEQYSLANQAKAILAMQPEAKFYLRGWVSAPIGWAKKRPGEVQTDEDGKTYRQASLSSRSYLEGLERSLQNMVTYIESQPWGKHMAGYLMAAYGEGLLPLTIVGKMFDRSEANRAAFKAWVARRYGNDDALRQAWRDPSASLDKVDVPRDRDWLAKRATLAPSIGGVTAHPETLPVNGGAHHKGLFHFIEPANAAPEHDYCRFMRDNFITWCRVQAHSIKQVCAKLGRRRIVGLDICKQPLLGWQILSAFDGIGDGQSAANLAILSGSFDVDELLDDADLDCLFTPADYHARTVGYAFEPEGPGDSLVLRKKTLFVENDARTYVGAGIRDQGAFRDIAEVRAGLLRNEAMPISRGFHSYWCNVGSSYFHDTEIQKVVASLVPVVKRSHDKPFHETRDAIAMVVDDSSPLFEDFTSGFQSLAVIWQRINGLAHCGVPYRIFLLSDLKRENFPRYRTYLFPNLFKVDDETITLLRRKVLCDGNVAIFGPATGITDGKVLTAEPATKLLGVRMELALRSPVHQVILQDPRGGPHKITAKLPASMTFGDSLPYGPALVPVDRGVESAGATPLGHATACFFMHRTGLFVREFGSGAAGNTAPGKRGPDDYAILWSFAAPLPANLLREAARYAGSHVWCEEDDVVYASDSFAALHSVKGGRRTLRLPRSARVTDAMTGERIGDAMTEVTFDVTPPATRMFLFE